MIEIGRKIVSNADCRYVLTKGSRGGDDSQIYLPEEIVKGLNLDLSDSPKGIKLTLIKENILDSLQLLFEYKKTELYHQGVEVDLNDKWREKQLEIINAHFGESKEIDYNISAKLLGKKDKRPFLNGLTDRTGFNIQEFLIPKMSNLIFTKEQDKVVMSISLSLRDFCFQVFNKTFLEFGSSFLDDNKEEFDTKVGDFDYIGVKFPKYFGSAKLLGFFDKEMAQKIIDSGNRFRYNKELVFIDTKNRECYFSTEFEYNKANDSHLLFIDFKRFIEEYSDGKYSIIKSEYGVYKKIFLEQGKNVIPDRKFLFSVKKSLREFAFRTFREVYGRFGEEFLGLKRSNFERTHNDKKIRAVGFQDYFGTKKIFAVFDAEQTKETLKTGTSIRYKPIDLEVMDEKFIYFSSQWSHPYDKSHPCYDEFVKFINDYGQGSFEIEYDSKEKIYSLFHLSDKKTSNDMKPIQKIFFGPPGTGKSHHIREEYGEDLPRVTFHPELDYQGFIGAYKPTMIPSPTGGEQITYKFIEESFLRAYCEAWRSEGPYYLVIEEINRGNCAQIFGDIFQLLDRKENGFSEYPIICSPDVQRHLSTELKNISRLQEYEMETNSDDFSRMSLPNNLNILCTMNTSDQSLFPMDSAFKRRWDWEYIPIDYKDADNFEIDLDDTKGKFGWGKVIIALNTSIKEHTQSEDKQLGNRFVSPANGTITKEEFVSKVVFYLWSEIYKEEHGSGDSIFYIGSDTPITFGDFFKGGKVDATITRKFIEYNLPANKVENNEDQTDSSESADDSKNHND